MTRLGAAADAAAPARPDPAGGHPLGEGRTAFGEPAAKALLRDRGVAVPEGVTVAWGGDARAPAPLREAAAALRPPLVLKAHGPGLLHKSDVGAVHLGLAPEELDVAARAMAEALAGHGITPDGVLVEEQQAQGGVELIVGVVRRPPFGHVVALGLGGVLAEVLDRVALRLCPLDEAAALDLVRSFPDAALLRGHRGAPPVDEGALVRVLLALAGPQGLAAELGDELHELELNPLRVDAAGAIALDARLVLSAPEAPSATSAPAPTDFARLFRPRAVAVAGASTNRPGFGNRALAAYRSAGWTDGLYALHPTADEVDGVPARHTPAELPEAVDYLLVAVPAARCAQVVRDTAGAVPFVQVVSGGFGESGPEGLGLGRELLEAAREVGARLVGPNCIGVYSPAGGQTFQLGDPTEPGPVSVVSQSGGLAGDVIKAGRERGLRFAKVATVGNALDVTPGELVHWLVDDPDTSVIGLYLEGPGEDPRLLEALRRARGRVPVALLLGGQSPSGAAAVASHTGAMVGDARVWEAVAEATGTTLVTTLEDLLAVLSYAQRWAGTDVDPGGGVLVLGVGGGASVLGADACDRAGLHVAPAGPAVQRALRDMGYGVGVNVTNPVEIPFGPVVPVDTLRKVLEPVLAAQPYADVLLHVNVQAYYSHGTEGIVPLLAQLDHLAAVDLATTRVAVVARNLECAPGDEARRLREHMAVLGLPCFRDFDEAAVAIRALERLSAARDEARP